MLTLQVHEILKASYTGYRPHVEPFLKNCVRHGGSREEDLTFSSQRAAQINFCSHEIFRNRKIQSLHGISTISNYKATIGGIREYDTEGLRFFSANKREYINLLSLILNKSVLSFHFCVPEEAGFNLKSPKQAVEPPVSPRLTSSQRLL